MRFGCSAPAWVSPCWLRTLLRGRSRCFLARDFTSPLSTVVVALATVVGHNYSVFLRGKGGKGVATGAGAATAMMPLPAACRDGCVCSYSADLAHCLRVVPGCGRFSRSSRPFSVNQLAVHSVSRCRSRCWSYGGTGPTWRLRQRTQSRRVNLPWGPTRPGPVSDDGVRLGPRTSVSRGRCGSWVVGHCLCRPSGSDRDWIRIAEAPPRK